MEDSNGNLDRQNFPEEVCEIWIGRSMIEPYELKPDADGKYCAKDVADALESAMHAVQQLHYWRGHRDTPKLEERQGAWKYKVKEIRAEQEKCAKFGLGGA